MAHNHNTRSNPLPNAMPTFGESPASGPAKHTAGHHRHDILNKMDPNVDSSRDKVILPPQGTATNGPHSSRLANKLDPTVDTDAYERANHLGGGVHRQAGAGRGTHGAAGAGYGHQQHHQTGVGAGYGQPGHAGLTGQGVGAHNPGASYLPGPAPSTAGPHKSDLMNKLDPTVDHKAGMTTAQRRGI
ncbi:hypothetical protein QBC39DRAFT_409113 [Podospora conica]|nr:hypothetical protein QBC39DRAFT_409113 [Schizothecium conicum]